MNSITEAALPRLQALMGQGVGAVDTPTLVLDLDAMERNLARMAAFAKDSGVRLRPHAKMHKSAVLARLQIQAGAVGVCVQKTSEAEALAAGGVNDIYISNEVIAPHKLQRVAALARVLSSRGGRLAIAVDSLQGVRALAHAINNTSPVRPELPVLSTVEGVEGLGGFDPSASSGQAKLSPNGIVNCGTAGDLIDVFVELDVGHGRCGVTSPEAAVALAREIARHSVLRFAGLQAYHGRAQHLRSVQDRREAFAAILAVVKAACAQLQAAGQSVALVTGAGTGSFALEAASGVYGELQAGSYLFMDADYARNETDPVLPRFEHALLIKTQVMSVCATHAVCDAGHKSHAIDSGLPRVLGDALEYFNGGDEHGVLRPLTPAGELPALGDVLWLIPGHCDPTVNLHDFLVGVRGGLQHGVVEQIIPVDARGALT